ncbi:MAG: META domain-containing protein [Geminicoccaceae bacterium]
MVRMLGLAASLAVVVAAQAPQAAARMPESNSRHEQVHTVAVESPADPFHGKVWQLFELQATPDAAPMHPSVPITLEIDTEAGQASGKGGCNRYFGGITLAGTQLSISGIGASQMACPPPAMNEEAAYLAALERVTGYAVDGDVLTLTLVGDGRLRYRELLDQPPG